MIAQRRSRCSYCGGGVVRAPARTGEFAAFLPTAWTAPVAITVMGAGGFPGGQSPHHRHDGYARLHASNMAVDACDLLIAVGCRFSDRVALNPPPSPSTRRSSRSTSTAAEINKNVQTDHHIIGDARRVLELLLERVPSTKHDDWKQ